LANTACSKLERLSIVRRTAERGDYTQVAPTYDLSDKGRKAAPAMAEQLLAAATQFYQAGQLQQAEQQAQRALKAKAPAGDVHTLLALIASASGDSGGAGSHYEQALAVAPGNGSYANNYGTWLCESGRAAESLDWFDKALADPAYSTRTAALANAGICAAKAGQKIRAEANWRQALAFDPVVTPALSGMARLQYEKGSYLDARGFVERWLALAPDDANALQLAAQIEQKLGDNAAAQRYLSRMQANPPTPGTTTPPRTQ
ncbi:MAG: type IV pilus biogenesis/stability protein PilW, partial [Thermomonas sp.]